MEEGFMEKWKNRFTEMVYINSEETLLKEAIEYLRFCEERFKNSIPVYKIRRLAMFFRNRMYERYNEIDAFTRSQLDSSIFKMLAFMAIEAVDFYQIAEKIYRKIDKKREFYS